MSEYQPVEQPNEAWAPAGGQASPSPMPLKEPEPPPPNDMLGYNPVAEDLDAGRIGLIWADAQAYADSPDKAIGRVSTYGAVPIDDVDSVRYNVIEMIRRARKEVVIATPFLIPGKSGIETIRASTERGVKFTIVTNSLAAAPEPAVHTAYRRYRPEMLGLGVDLFETSPIRVSRSLRLGRFSTSVGKLHAKCAVIDRETVFIGSMNFDPRSEQHNTELGLFIHSPTLAQQVLKLVDVIKQQGSYQVRLAPNGQDVQWEVLGSYRPGAAGGGTGNQHVVAVHDRRAVARRTRRPAVASSDRGGRGAAASLHLDRLDLDDQPHRVLEAELQAPEDAPLAAHDGGLEIAAADLALEQRVDVAVELHAPSAPPGGSCPSASAGPAPR